MTDAASVCTPADFSVEQCALLGANTSIAARLAYAGSTYISSS